MTRFKPVIFDFWPLPRPMTKHWGNGPQLWKRLCETFGQPDIVFGKTDGIPNGVLAVDKNSGSSVKSQWDALPFKDSQFTFGYWDPPYDKLYAKEAREIWRVCERLAVLHTHIYPTTWFPIAERTGMIAVTMGPLKKIRCLQVFEKRWEGLRL